MSDLVKRLRENYEALRGPDYYEAAATIEAQAAEIERLRGEIYVPGMWHCAKCKFTLLQSNLNANDGTVTPRDQPGDKCPNCDSPLWRCTWKQDAFEMQERAVEQMGRAKAAEARIEQAESALAELTPVKDMLALCGELGGMGTDEAPADYLRRLIDEVAGKEQNEGKK